MGILPDLETRFNALVKTVMGEERRELAAMVKAAKMAEDTAVKRLIEFKPQLLVLLEDAEPAIQQAAGVNVEQLIADVIAILSAVPSPPPSAPPAPTASDAVSVTSSPKASW